MTAYSPAALRELKKKIVHAAIRQTLYEEPVRWDGNAEEGFYGAMWEGRLPPVGGPTGTITLKYSPPGLGFAAGAPPGAVYVGDGYDAAGQPYLRYTVDPWTSIYQPWIDRIEQAFLGWDEIPDPGDFEDPIEHVRLAVGRLTPLPTGAGGNDEDGDFATTYSDVEVETALGTMDAFVGADTVGAEEGLLVYAFRQGYGPDRIRAIMGNQAQVAILLGIALQGEKNLWAAARDDIMKIAATAAESFGPGGATGGGSIDLGVVKAFVGLLGAFAPAPLKPVLAVGTASLALIDELIPEEQPGGDSSVELTGWTPEEVYSSLVDVIGTLEQRVFDQEYELAYKTLGGLLDYLHGHAASQFHIHPTQGIDADLADAPALSVHPEYLRKVGYQLVPRIAAAMGHAAEDALAANRSGIWLRSNAIGMGSSGPYAKWTEVQGEFDKVTTGSGRELVEAGRLLAVGAGWTEDSDQDSRTELEGVQDDLDRGSDGWDNSVPKVPTGPGGFFNRPI